MESFGVFCVEVIGSAKDFDKLVVVVDKMVLGKVEVGTNTKVDKHLPVVMVHAKGIIELLERFGCMDREFCKVEEVQKAPDRM